MVDRVASNRLHNTPIGTPRRPASLTRGTSLGRDTSANYTRIPVDELEEREEQNAASAKAGLTLTQQLASHQFTKARDPKKKGFLWHLLQRRLFLDHGITTAHFLWWAITIAGQVVGIIYLNDLKVTILPVLLIRNEWIVWLIYMIMTSFTALLPASHFKEFLNDVAVANGAIHTGGAWVTLVHAGILVANQSLAPIIHSLTVAIFGCLVAIISFALPWGRHTGPGHDVWELSHRYLGWALLGLLIAIVVLQTFENQATTKDYILLGIICFLVAYPWIPYVGIRKVTLDVERSSKKLTRLHFKRTRHCSAAGTATKVSLNHPVTGILSFFTSIISLILGEYHAFAVLPDLDDPDRAMLAVGNVGDWTNRLNILATQNKEVYVYMRYVNSPGFMYLVRTYRRVVCVCTGTGIAPVSAYLLSQRNSRTELPADAPEMLVLWVGADHENTYGEDLMAKVRTVPNLIMIDTHKPPSYDNPYFPWVSLSFDKSGQIVNTPNPPDAPYGKKGVHADVSILALAAWELFNAEAVFVVSRQDATYKTVNFLAQHGVAAYGAVFDS